MNSIDLGDESGFVSVKASDVEVRLDLYETHDRIAAATKNKEGSEASKAVANLMVELGFPEPSRRTAVLFANAIIEAVEGFKKKPDGPAGAVGSTASTAAA